MPLVTGLVIFLGVHSISIVAPAWRDSMAARLGPGAWKGLYTLASIVGFALVVWGYGLARETPIAIYYPAAWTRHAAALLMLPVFPLLLAAYLPGRIRTAVKHPMLLATQAWAVAHLLANGMLADVLLFGSFLAWAVADRISIGTRQARALPGARPAPMNDWIAIIGGLAIYGLFVGILHVRLIGVAPTP